MITREKANRPDVVVNILSMNRDAPSPLPSPPVGERVSGGRVRGITPGSWSQCMREGEWSLSMNHCQERGQPCPREPNFQDSRTRLSALLSVDGSSSQCMRKKRKRALHELPNMANEFTADESDAKFHAKYSSANLTRSRSPLSLTGLVANLRPDEPHRGTVCPVKQSGSERLRCLYWRRRPEFGRHSRTRP